MKQVKLYHYEIPIQTKLVLKQQTLTIREGMLIHLSVENKSGWGEIAPLPMFSHESFNQAKAETLQWINGWLNDKPTCIEQASPSVAFGISMALRELDKGILSPTSITTVPLYSGNLQQFNQQLLTTDSEVVKVKIARADPIAEGKMVNQFLHAFPHLKVRLDANRAWSLIQACQFSTQIDKQCQERILFIEEPCYTAALSKEFALLTKIAIAWDESLRENEALLTPTPYLTAIVIKPSLTGSVRKCIQLIKLAEQYGLSAVISSSLESSLGLSQLAQLATIYTPTIPAGLDTLNLMSYQLVRAYPNSTLPLLDIRSEYIQEIPLENGVCQ